MMEIFKMLKAGYQIGKAINSVAKKRGNPMAAVSLVWGPSFLMVSSLTGGFGLSPKA